jgi:hypothetical protein
MPVAFLWVDTAGAAAIFVSATPQYLPRTNAKATRLAQKLSSTLCKFRRPAEGGSVGSFSRQGLKPALLACRLLSDLNVRPPGLPLMPPIPALRGCEEPRLVMDIRAPVGI